MRVWAIASETQILQAIWLGIAALSLASVVIMVILILRRFRVERVAQHHALRTQALTRCFYAALKAPVTLNAASLIPVTAADHPLIMRAAVDLLRAVRGEDVERVVQVLTLWNMQPYLERMAREGRKGKRIQALTLLSHFSDPASLSVLLEQTRNSDMYIQLAALRGLVMRGAIGLLPQIVQSLSQAGRTNMLMLSDILRRFGTPAVPGLIELAQSNATRDVRIAAVMALGDIGALEALDALLELANNPETELRAHVMAALGKIGDQRASKTIAAHLSDAHVAVRVQAAQALGNLQHLATMPQLAELLDDPEWWVRFRAAEALHRFGVKGQAFLQSVGGQPTRAGLIARQVLAERAGGM